MREGALNEALRGRGPGRLVLCHIGEGTDPGPDVPGDGVEVVDLRKADGREFDGPVERVVVLAGTTADLRAAVPLSAGLPSAADLRVVVAASARHTGPPLPTPPGLGQWEGLLHFQVGRLQGRGWSCSFAFTDPVDSGAVLRAVAQAMVGGRRGQAPPRRQDPDVVPATVPTWAVLGRPGALSARPALRELSVEDVPVVDERVVNPMGFRHGSTPRVGRLVSRGGRWVLVAGNGVRWRVPEDGAVSDVDVAGLRDLRAVRVEWGRHSGPLAAVRAVAGLAAAGIPLVSGPVPGWARCLGGELSDLVTSVEERLMVDPQSREEHSVRLRRAALRLHGAHGRARLLADAGGPPVPAEPSVSVVLCTRRPEMVGFALRQVARQRGVDVEVVLALHGFSAEAPGVAAAIAEFRRGGRSAVVWEPPEDLVFGSVLNGAIARASGTLVAKMDDDDWYGPEHLSDLVLARRYSGADLVGSIVSFVYLESLDRTVRLAGKTDTLWHRAAGGTLMTDRRTLEEAGGFARVSTAEDTHLLAAIERMGARIHRGHGCNYVLRRKAGGHTWGVGAGYFLRLCGEQQLPGWRPSALLEPDPEDLPTTVLAGTWTDLAEAEEERIRFAGATR
ncbi:glycosyltransferase [Nocardiopsis sp. NPDC058789]|uniref:glycosyltransferase n=1 Tax=Nocardiopsis sp. NPDC058789 TaxID=3346634 RepID=UPI00366D52ED